MATRPKGNGCSGVSSSLLPHGVCMGVSLSLPDPLGETKESSWNKKAFAKTVSPLKYVCLQRYWLAQNWPEMEPNWRWRGNFSWSFLQGLHKHPQPALPKLTKWTTQGSKEQCALKDILLRAYIRFMGFAVFVRRFLTMVMCEY